MFWERDKYLQNKFPFTWNHHLRYFSLLAHSGVQRMLCCVFDFFIFVLCLVYPILSVSLDCPLLISTSVFLNVYSIMFWHIVQSWEYKYIKFKQQYIKLHTLTGKYDLPLCIIMVMVYSVYVTILNTTQLPQIINQEVFLVIYYILIYKHLNLLTLYN